MSTVTLPTGRSETGHQVLPLQGGPMSSCVMVLVYTEN